MPSTPDAGPSAVVFDLFGTLTVDQTSLERNRWQEPVAEVLGLPHEAPSRMLRSSFHERATGAWGSAAHGLREIAGQLGIEPSDDAIEIAVSLRQTAEVQLARPRPGTVELLAELHAAGVPVGVLSDCTWELVAVWDQLPYAALVDAAVFSVEMGTRKPARLMYDEITRRLGVECANVVYVGDGGSQELTGALAAGMRPVLLRSSLDEPATTTDLRYDADAQWHGGHVRDMAELRQLLISTGLITA
jgi:putative hydrolase of the HAD superfamily